MIHQRSDDHRRLWRRHLSYANVAATLAVILAMSGVVYAASLPRSSVGTRQLKNRAVTTPKLAAGAVGTKKVADRSLSLADLGGTDYSDNVWATSAPITLGSGQCKSQPAGTFDDSLLGAMSIGTLTDPNGEAALPQHTNFAFLPSIAIDTSTPLVVCNTGDAPTITIPAGSVFHYRFIAP